MNEKKVIEFIVDINGIMSTDTRDDDMQNDMEEIRCRVRNHITDEIKERSCTPSAFFSDVFYLLEMADILDSDVRMIRWISKNALDCKMKTRMKCLMALGYVTAPELYPEDIAEKYEELIRKNTARLFRCAAYY